jgi:hypothetical protein
MSSLTIRLTPPGHGVSLSGLKGSAVHYLLCQSSNRLASDELLTCSDARCRNPRGHVSGSRWCGYTSAQVCANNNWRSSPSRWNTPSAHSGVVSRGPGRGALPPPSVGGRHRQVPCVPRSSRTSNVSLSAATVASARSTQPPGARVLSRPSGSLLSESLGGVDCAFLLRGCQGRWGCCHAMRVRSEGADCYWWSRARSCRQPKGTLSWPRNRRTPQ